MTMVNSEQRVSDGNIGGSSAATLVASLKVQSGTLKADLQQRLAGKDSAVYKDTLEKLQAQTPDNATLEERERAIEYVIQGIDYMPVTEWDKGSMWERIPDVLANEIAAAIFDEKVKYVIIKKVAQIVVTQAVKRTLGVTAPGVADLFFSNEANPLTPSEKKKKRERARMQ